jgi:hypothetical protein
MMVNELARAPVLFSYEFSFGEHVWKALLQRFENTLIYKNFPGPKDLLHSGTLFCDQTDEKKLRGLLRKLSIYNPIPNQA